MPNSTIELGTVVRSKRTGYGWVVVRLGEKPEVVVLQPVNNNGAVLFEDRATFWRDYEAAS